MKKLTRIEYNLSPKEISHPFRPNDRVIIQPHKDWLVSDGTSPSDDYTEGVVIDQRGDSVAVGMETANKIVAVSSGRLRPVETSIRAISGK